MILFLLVLSTDLGQPASCGPALQQAEVRMLRGEADVHRDLPDTCAQLTLARLALRGWDEARALAPKGGPVDLHGPVNATLKELDALRGEFALEVEYAQTVIRAALAAAQDERSDMDLFLVHARDLSERLATRRRGDTWPRTFNLAAGELWFEVDRFEESLRAYERATRGRDAPPIAWIGLARAHARSGNRRAACDGYHRVHKAAPALMAEAAAYLAACP